MTKNHSILKVLLVCLLIFPINTITDISRAGLIKTGMSTYEIENENKNRDSIKNKEKNEIPENNKPKGPYGETYDSNNPYGEWEK